MSTGLPLPCIFYECRDPLAMAERLRREYYSTYNEAPSHQQIAAWRASFEALCGAGLNYPLIAEYPVFEFERADFILVGRNKALIVEAKGWKDIKRINDYVVYADGQLEQDACYQVNNYVSKFEFFHSASERLDFEGVVYAYNRPSYQGGCRIVTDPEGLQDVVSGLGKPGGEEEVRSLVEGNFVIRQDIVELIRSSRDDLLRRAGWALVSRGYGLTKEQLLIVEEALLALENGQKKVILVRGESGSGKTLIAVTLLLEAVASGYRALLGYRNNRLLNTLRKVLTVGRAGVNLSSLIKFYSTGRGFGIGEERFPIEKYAPLDLLIFDEAQRMTKDVIRRTMERASVIVYFYDESQILIGDEAGTRENFLQFAPHAKEMVLSSLFRAPKRYIQAIKALLEGSRIPELPAGYDFKILPDIAGLLSELARRREEGNKVALVCAFTESEGDRYNPLSIKNVRIGYPLQSGFDLYKHSGIEIRWLMDEQKEYPRYWMGLLDPLKYCASVYGAQGFEAQYVGVVWGRDLLWRNGVWVVNPDVVMDDVGGPQSLRSISRRDQARALSLLKNRYYVMLTRGIKGTYLFFEDPDTWRHVESMFTSS